MNRRLTDALVGLFVVSILLVGGGLSWQAFQQQRALDQMGSMMGTSMGAVHGTNPLWYVFGTIVVAGAFGGGYLILRDTLQHADIASVSQVDSTRVDDSPTDDASSSRSQTGGASPSELSRTRVLDVLPDDERRVLEPVLTSPGITQIELRDRSDFSKSKVSQTVSSLEKRGLLYREKQGRTYRIYPSDDLRQ